VENSDRKKKVCSTILKQPSEVGVKYRSKFVLFKKGSTSILRGKNTKKKRVKIPGTRRARSLRSVTDLFKGRKGTKNSKKTKKKKQNKKKIGEGQKITSNGWTGIKSNFSFDMLRQNSVRDEKVGHKWRKEGTWSVRCQCSRVGLAAGRVIAAKANASSPTLIDAS